MQTHEEFLKEYFQCRTDLLNDLCHKWDAVSPRYFAPDCRACDRRKTVEESASEKILAIEEKDDVKLVTTTGQMSGRVRFRYSIMKSGHGLQISKIEMECSLCLASGKEKTSPNECRFCNGAGWKRLGLD